MKSKTAVNFILVFLFALTIIQTCALWLDDAESDGIIGSFFGTFKEETQSEENLIVIEPEKYLIGYGNKRFSVAYRSRFSKDIEKACEASLKEIFSSGIYVGTEACDWETYYYSPGAVLKFPFSVSVTEYVKAYGEAASEITGRFKSFDYIVINRSEEDLSDISAFFLNSETNEAHEISVQESSTIRELSAAIDGYYDETTALFSYISARQNSFNMFKSNVLIPQWGSEGLTYRKTKSAVPFMKENEILASEIEMGTAGFFSDITTKFAGFDEDGNYTVSDEATIVKYTSQNVLEYYSYYKYDSETEQTLASAYTACAEFLKKDGTLDTDIYLSGVQLKSDGLVFYFDYTSGNLPVYITEETLAKAELAHAIEVTVKNGAVKTYRRYAANFSLEDGNEGRAELDFLSAVFNAMSYYGGGSQINDIALAYYYDGGDSLSLKWLVDLGGSVYADDTLNAEE